MLVVLVVSCSLAQRHNARQALTASQQRMVLNLRRLALPRMGESERPGASGRRVALGLSLRRTSEIRVGDRVIAGNDWNSSTPAYGIVRAQARGLLERRSSAHQYPRVSHHPLSITTTALQPYTPSTPNVRCILHTSEALLRL